MVPPMVVAVKFDSTQLVIALESDDAATTAAAADEVVDLAVGDVLLEDLQGRPRVGAVEPADGHHRLLTGQLVAGGLVGADGCGGPRVLVGVLLQGAVSSALGVLAPRIPPMPPASVRRCRRAAGRSGRCPSGPPVAAAREAADAAGCLRRREAAGAGRARRSRHPTDGDAVGSAPAWGTAAVAIDAAAGAIRPATHRRGQRDGPAGAADVVGGQHADDADDRADDDERLQPGVEVRRARQQCAPSTTRSGR